MNTDDAAKDGLVRPFWLRPNAPKRWIEKIHEYRDADGRLVFVRVRVRSADGSKDVTYRRPVASHKDYSHPKVSAGHDGRGWIPEAPKDASEYLYRLPELWEALSLDAPEVAWTEGESDADAVALHCPDMPVTSHHGGAGNSTPGQVDWFRGYEGHVWVVADLDDPGAYCAAKRLDQLRALGVSASALAPAAGKDVRDHLEAGLGWSALVEVDEDQLRTVAKHATPAAFRRAGYDIEKWAELLCAIEKWTPRVERKTATWSRGGSVRAGWKPSGREKW